MSQLPLIDANAADTQTKTTLAAVNAALGVTPNLFLTAANSPAGLQALVGLSGALAKGKLNAKVRESIALAVAQENGCDYCLSAHTALGAGAGLTDAEMKQARESAASDVRVAAILRLTNDVVRTHGRVGAAAVAAAKSAGVSDAEIVEIVANVALNIYTNYLNVLNDTEIDFPVVNANDLIAA